MGRKTRSTNNDEPLEEVSLELEEVAVAEEPETVIVDEPVTTPEEAPKTETAGVEAPATARVQQDVYGKVRIGGVTLERGKPSPNLPKKLAQSIARKKGFEIVGGEDLAEETASKGVEKG